MEPRRDDGDDDGVQFVVLGEDDIAAMEPRRDDGDDDLCGIGDNRTSRRRNGAPS